MENVEVMKTTELRNIIFNSIGILVQKYNHALGSLIGNFEETDPVIGASTAIVHMLPHFEHLAPNLAELLQLLEKSYNASRVATDVLRFLGCSEVTLIR